MWKCVIASVLIVSLGLTKAYGTSTINIAVFDDQLVFFNSLLNHSDCPSIEESDVGSNLMLAEYILLCNIISQHFEDVKFNLVGLPIVPRIAAALEQGTADISGFGIWQGESAKFGVHRTAEIMQKGEFTKGLFTSKSKRDALVVAGNINLQELVAVSNRNWTYDWTALRCSGMSVAHVSRYEQMFQLVKLKRADVLPLGFGKSGALSKTEFAIQLYPIPGIKLVIPDSSHYLVSKKSLYATRLLAVVNQGLKTMRASGDLTALLERVGAINEETRQWRSICDPQQVAN